METENHDNTPTASQSAPNPLDLALARLESIIVGIEDERATAEELATVPEDIPRFVTRYEP
jgi:hypothetical protein